MRVVAFIQARASSSRFPGKVTAELGGLPMIAFMVERVRRARTIDRIVVVTSDDPSDDGMAAILAERGIECFRGALDDVLGRFAAAAAVYRPEIVIRLTGDCPLIDPALIDDVVTALREQQADYATNSEPPSFPDGMDVEVFTNALLTETAAKATAPAEREHVTLFMRRLDAPHRNISVAGPLDASHLRLTVDYPDDLEVVRAVVAWFGNRRDFDVYDIYRCLHAQPALQQLNVHTRNEGLALSLAADADAGA